MLSIIKYRITDKFRQVSNFLKNDRILVYRFQRNVLIMKIPKYEFLIEVKRKTNER
jgi:hypothetical protein